MFRKGSTLVNLGLGVGTGYGYDFADRADATPAISLAAEKGVLDGIGPGVLSVGGLLGYKGYHYAYPNTDYKARWTTVVALVRGSYHYDLLENKQLDTYAGVSLGLRLETHRDTYYDAMPDKRPATSFGGVRFASGIYLGARYLLTSHLGAFAEAGYDMSYLKFGLTGQF